MGMLEGAHHRNRQRAFISSDEFWFRLEETNCSDKRYPVYVLLAHKLPILCVQPGNENVDISALGTQCNLLGFPVMSQLYFDLSEIINSFLYSTSDDAPQGKTIQ